MIDGAEIHFGNYLQNNGNNNPLCAVMSSYSAWEVMTFQCRGIEGRYVNVFLPGCNKDLSLCEVEVNVGSRPERRVQDMKRGQNILCLHHKTQYESAATVASQSSQWDKFGNANNAIDLNWTNWYLEGSCSHTKADIDSWWRVNLRPTTSPTSPLPTEGTAAPIGSVEQRSTLGNHCSTTAIATHCDLSS
ncbi:fucolectin-3-like isoform X2 [Salvelinus namaycush]|uniref:Fucolectin-3-like isoform X2 n=1 Tax=Salvelinus namaycush TaxID=8040 RepID=A0A8U0TY48_SALNM|nr:fucolectin-3-like isoform X2 [Salvelinus namaycush]